MRIVHLITRLIIGGAQENTLLNCEDLVRDYGDEVLLITGSETGPEGSLFSRLQDTSRAVHERVKYEIVPTLRREIQPINDVRAYFQVKNILRQFRADVVHTHSAKAGIIGRFAASRLRVPCIVHTIHGSPFWETQSFFKKRFYMMCEKLAARCCHKLISVADAMTEQMVAACIAPRAFFTTIRSGMETETFLATPTRRDEIRARFGFTSEQIVVGKIARLFELKGHEYLLESAREVARRAPNIRFLLVGDGILTPHFRSEVQRLGIADKVVFAGLVPPSEIPAMISAMDIVAHTSLREGLARVLPQAMLSGKPVISYDIDGAREVVTNGETGFLLPPRDITELAARIIQLATNPALREELGRNGRDRCRIDFDHHVMTRQIRALYTHILQQNVGQVSFSSQLIQ